MSMSTLRNERADGDRDAHDSCARQNAANANGNENILHLLVEHSACSDWQENFARIHLFIKGAHYVI